MTVLSAGGGVDYVDGNTWETVEGLLAKLQEKEPGELYMYTRVQVTERIDPLQAMKTSKEQLR